MKETDANHWFPFLAVGISVLVIIGMVGLTRCVSAPKQARESRCFDLDEGIRACQFGPYVCFVTSHDAISCVDWGDRGNQKL